MKKKSLKERFLLVIGMLFFIIYLTMGLAVLFWDRLPLPLSQGYRAVLGLAIIGYAFLRFIRFFQKS
ncbi:MAG: hypothetical protein V4670_09095 [Bacteroidota bacterium]